MAFHVNYLYLYRRDGRKKVYQIHDSFSGIKKLRTGK